MNDVEQWVIDLNANLERFYWFRAYKFIIGLYLIIVTAALILILFRLVKMNFFKVLIYGQGFPKILQGKYQAKWQKAVQRLHSENPSDWKTSIIEMAELVDSILIMIKYPGESMGERLDGMLPNQINNLEQIKQAQQVYQRVSDDPTYQLSREEAMQTLEIFGKALQFFQAIE